jgi:hypothetical protein
MGITAAAKIAVNPRILYQAAIVLNVNAVIKVRLVRVNNFLIAIDIFSRPVGEEYHCCLDQIDIHMCQ